jgi:signal transduction histidine kinase
MESSAAVSRTFVGDLEEPAQIMSRLVENALAEVDADRCTLTSIDRSVMRVEASRQRDGQVPSFLHAEYPLESVQEQPLLREAVATGRIATGPGFAESPRVGGDVRRELGDIRHVAVVPLVEAGVTQALLILSRGQDREFNRDELQSLQRVGAMGLLALRNARLLEEVESAQRHGLDVLTRISQLVAVSDDHNTFFEKMSETVAQLVNAHRAAFWLLLGEELVAQPAQGFSDEERSRMRVSTRGDSLAGFRPALYEGLAVRFSVSKLAPDDPWRPLLEMMNVSDGLAVPWRTAREPIGVLMAYDSHSGGWSAQTEWMLRLSARSSALVWQGYEAERRVAELRAAEVDRLAEVAARIASLDEQKSDFLRLASHELRTPITVVRGYLSMLEEGALGTLPPEAARVIPVMSSRTTQMSALVEEMLAASRAQDTGFVPLLEEVDMEQLVRSAVAELNGASGDHDIRVEASGGACAMADPDKAHTIVANLLSNAVKYSPGGGAVAVRVSRRDDTVAVDVSDAGIGIGAADLERLFRPFGRAETAETRAIPGIGLGLYLSRRLARLQGGDVTVESAPGAGSTFTLCLPAVAEPER